MLDAREGYAVRMFVAAYFGVRQAIILVVNKPKVWISSAGHDFHQWGLGTRKRFPPRTTPASAH